MFHELLWRDRDDGRATGQPQGVGSEAHLNGTSQGSTPEDAREDGHSRDRSRQFMKHPGYYVSSTAVICLFHIAQENTKICGTHGWVTASITIVGENIHVGAIPA